MSRLWWMLGCIALLGCSRQEDAPAQPRGLVDSQGHPLASAKPSSKKEEEPLHPASGPREQHPALPSLFVEDDSGAPAAEDRVGEASPDGGEAGEKDERDLPTELAALVGRPLDCLDLKAVANTGGKLKVRITAYVVASGAITRAQVTAPGQPQSALTCIEKRTVVARLADPVPDAPRRVVAEFDFEVVRAADPASGGSDSRPAAGGPDRRDVAEPVPGDVAKPVPGDVAGAP